MRFYKHHLGDYDSATSHLTWLEDMAYTRLLRIYYRDEKPIPLDQVYKLVRAKSRHEKRAVDTVVASFFQVEDNSLVNVRAQHEIAQYQAQAKINREIGKLGGRPKKTESVTDRFREKTLTINHYPDSVLASDSDVGLFVSPTSLSSVGAEPKKNGSAHPAVTPVELIPLNSGVDYPVDEVFTKELERLYPAVDVRQTLREIRGWCLANATRRKTARGVRAFINSWMQREQNRG